MTVDIEKLEALAKAANGFSDVSLAPDVLLEMINDSKRIKAELDGVDPCFEDVQRLCKVLGYLGVSTPESGHEQAARWLSLVRNLIRTAETSKLLRHDSHAIAEYSQLKSENAGLKTGYQAYERLNAELRAECEKLRNDAMPLESVAGDQLPPVGSTVLIHLGRSDAWVEHTVVGYYAWCDLTGNKNLHRVFVRVRDGDGYLNARLLKDVRAQSAKSKEPHK